MTRQPVPHITPPASLRREDAARYCGCSATHFDGLVRQAIMPLPRDLAGVKVWLRSELDDALLGLMPIGGEKRDNSFDGLFGL